MATEPENPTEPDNPTEPENPTEKASVESTAGESPKQDYEVSVVHYAQYDDAAPGYAPEVVASIQYASRNPLSRFFIDFATVLVHPSKFWKGQDAHPATLLHVHVPHLAILVLLRLTASFLGGAFRPQYAPSALIVQTVVQGLLIFVLVWGMSLVVATATAITGAGFHFDRALRFVAYSITPILFVGIVGAIPVPYIAQICDLLAMPWAFVAMGTAILSYLHIKESRAPVISALFCGILLCLWGALPMLIPYLLSLKLFS